MKIYREINGTSVEIELTVEELHNAYYEAQDKFDVADIDYFLEDYFDDHASFEEEFGISMEVFRENCMEFAGQMLRKYIERNEDCSDAQWNARNDAVRTAAEHYLEAHKAV